MRKRNSATTVNMVRAEGGCDGHVKSKTCIRMSGNFWGYPVLGLTGTQVVRIAQSLNLCPGPESEYRSWDEEIRHRVPRFADVRVSADGRLHAGMAC